MDFRKTRNLSVMEVQISQMIQLRRHLNRDSTLFIVYHLKLQSPNILYENKK